ncbi:MAG: GDSL-type esterase/lipase family protein [Nocardioides sp.]
MRTDPDAVRVLCFGDSNTHGAPADDPEFLRLGPDVRWTGRLQRLLGDGYEVVEEGLNGRTTDVDYVDRPHCNGRTYFPAALMSHHPLDVVVVMLGSNDFKTCFDGRSAATIAAALHGYVDDVATYVTDRQGRTPSVLLLSPILLDDSITAYVDPSGNGFDARSLEASRGLAAEIRSVAKARGVLFADAASVARAGGDALHLTHDSHQPLAELVAATISGSATRRP